MAKVQGMIEMPLNIWSNQSTERLRCRLSAAILVAGPGCAERWAQR
jgi:hypothetical protein